MVKEIGILLGNKCNFKCKHCLGTIDKTDIKETEVYLLTKFINKYKFRELLFVGGEPTLYIKQINKIISRVNNFGEKEIKITTNGSFAKDVKSAEKVLTSFKKIDALQLSYDKFHRDFLPFENVKNLYQTCKKLNIEFSVILTISNPFDLMLVKELRKIGKFLIGVQKVLPIGNAVNNNVYWKDSSFDSRLLYKKCPNFKKIKFFPSKGFSVCCSYLMYNSNLRVIKKVSNRNLDIYFESFFYKIITNYNFKEILNKLNLSIDFKDKKIVSECDVCKEIFLKYYGK